MRYLPVICFLLASSMWGQQAPPSAPSEVPSQPQIPRDDEDQPTLPASASKVASDAAVITIKGLCLPPSSPCQTQISRTRFEELADAILTNKQPARQRQLAESYPNLLAMAQAAEARGVENSPRFKEKLEFARLQILAQELVRRIDEESSNVSDKEIEEYYQNHSGDFVRATFDRIYIPNRKRADLANQKAKGEAVTESADEMIRVAEELHRRAVAGESFAILQKDAYAAAGMSDVPPNPSMGRLKLSELPRDHASVFDLKPGEVSQVISDSTGHYVYKLDSKEKEGIDKRKEEIRRILKAQHKQQAIEAIHQPITTELNPAYFGSNETAGKPGSKPD